MAGEEGELQSGLSRFSPSLSFRDLVSLRTFLRMCWTGWQGVTARQRERFQCCPGGWSGKCSTDATYSCVPPLTQQVLTENLLCSGSHPRDMGFIRTQKSRILVEQRKADGNYCIMTLAKVGNRYGCMQLRAKGSGQRESTECDVRWILWGGVRRVGRPFHPGCLVLAILRGST